MNTEKKDRKQIFTLFCQVFDNLAFEIVSGLNPCSIIYRGVPFNVYIKNLTPAQLSNNNPDVWRCQLPKREIFEDFKTSNNLFVLLGYDAENDVYATWNPYWAKQRLNVGESVSMYSRLSVQRKAAQEQNFITFDLNHNSSVVAFPRLLLPKYLETVSDFFPLDTEYVPVGSSLRKNKMYETMTVNQDLFSEFFSNEMLDYYERYLSGTTLKGSTQRSYKGYIVFLHENGYIRRHSNIFLQYDCIEDYEKAVKSFYTQEDIAYIDRDGPGGWHGAIRAAVKYYYKAFKNKHDGGAIGIPAKAVDTPKISIDLREEIDGKPNIATPKLIRKIAPLMCKEEPEEMVAMQILFDEFGNKYQDVMPFNDWIKLLRETPWAKLIELFQQSEEYRKVADESEV